MILRKNAGFTIVENVIALAILSIVSIALIGALAMLKQVSLSTRVMTSSDKQISDIVDSIRIGIEDHQVNFKQEVSTTYSFQEIDKILSPKTLPMAWDNGIVVPTDQCPTCAGRYGFVIQPYTLYPGLYIVTLRLTHRSWKMDAKDYEFVVSAK